MAERITVYWRDIPAQVIVRKGRTTARRELSARFIECIDSVAMRTGARDSEAYLTDWRRSDPVACGDDLEAEADAAMAALEMEYHTARLAVLLRQDGRDTLG